MFSSAMVNGLQLTVMNRSSSPLNLLLIFMEGFDIIRAEVQIPVSYERQNIEIPLAELKITRSEKPLLYGHFEIVASTNDLSPIRFQLFDSLIFKKDPYFLKQYNLNLRVLKGSVEPFFKTVTGRPSLRFFGASATVRQNSIPVESGFFGQEHGELSHTYQLICLLYGMTREEANVIRVFYNQLATSGGAPEFWSIWDTLFDGNGNTLPTEPRFWRDLSGR